MDATTLSFLTNKAALAIHSSAFGAQNVGRRPFPWPTQRSLLLCHADVDCARMCRSSTKGIARVCSITTTTTPR